VRTVNCCGDLRRHTCKYFNSSWHSLHAPTIRGSTFMATRCLLKLWWSECKQCNRSTWKTGTSSSSQLSLNTRSNMDIQLMLLLLSLSLSPEVQCTEHNQSTSSNRICNPQATNLNHDTNFHNCLSESEHFFVVVVDDSPESWSSSESRIECILYNSTRNTATKSSAHNKGHTCRAPWMSTL